MHSIAYKSTLQITTMCLPRPLKYRHQGIMSPVIEDSVEVSSLTPLVVPASLIFAFLDSMW